MKCTNCGKEFPEKELYMNAQNVTSEGLRESERRHLEE